MSLRAVVSDILDQMEREGVLSIYAWKHYVAMFRLALKATEGEEQPRFISQSSDPMPYKGPFPDKPVDVAYEQWKLVQAERAKIREERMKQQITPAEEIELGAKIGMDD